ncbi:hypothetical protein LHGZ1_1730 [Laribacter hongkongensis]|uniref:Uncharacterized protein n=1 Tax=Laribacter hongkongensis TaxID=168471 RepID=A0A248LJ97_9NEIS|nr:hypothetical protein LHGZ1_1730 [Laribacter hongkongensis]
MAESPGESWTLRCFAGVAGCCRHSWQIMPVSGRLLRGCGVSA